MFDDFIPLRHVPPQLLTSNDTNVQARLVKPPRETSEFFSGRQWRWLWCAHEGPAQASIVRMRQPAQLPKVAQGNEFYTGAFPQVGMLVGSSNLQ